MEVYNSAGDNFQDTEYAQIVDESMMIGSEKSLLTLGVPAEHQEHSLQCEDVEVLDIAVAESWNGEGVKDRLEAVSKKVGHAPMYVISDNASIMNKGIRCVEFNHQHDISHSLGMFLERTYKKESDFIKYGKLMTEPKFKYNMKQVAYLLPPKQRTIARFINMSHWIKWSSKMLEIYPDLSVEEQSIFSFIPANASLIGELSEVRQCVNKIESLCKNKGLSKQTVKECRQEINRHLFNGNSRMIKLGEEIYNFLTEEVKIVPSGSAHNNSSDIIESIFGKYKARKSPNKLNGGTPFILLLPLYTAISSSSKRRKFDFKNALENNKMKEIEMWSKQNLKQNLMQLRKMRSNKIA